MRTATLIPVLLTAVLVGCTPGRPGTVEPGPNDRFVLTGEEIRSHVFASTYDAIERLRPWLLTPIRDTPTELYVDGLLQPLDVLRGLPPEVVVDLRYVHGADAVRLPGGRSALVLTTNAAARRTP